jgi:hypothetical protein
VLPSRDQGLGSLTGCLDRALRIIAGAPAYLLTDNAKTVTVEHVAGIPVRDPDMVALGRHYGWTVQTCRPFDPESKGGTEATVKIARWDLVPAEANLREEYASFGELEAACEQFGDRVNGRVHRESAASHVGTSPRSKRNAAEARVIDVNPGLPDAFPGEAVACQEPVAAKITRTRTRSVSVPTPM